MYVYASWSYNWVSIDLDWDEWALMSGRIVWLFFYHGVTILYAVLTREMQELSPQRLIPYSFNSMALCKDFSEFIIFFNDSTFISLFINLYLVSYFKFLKTLSHIYIYIYAIFLKARILFWSCLIGLSLADESDKLILAWEEVGVRKRAQLKNTETAILFYMP